MDERVREIIESSRNIVFFGGAGVSTESGIPDFRSEKGLYNAMQEYGRSPETMLSRSFFDRNMETFYDYYRKNLIYPQARPNDAHYALYRLEKEGRLKGIVTQNIDGLHQKAGSKAVFELHGSVLRNFCMDCGASFSVDYILDPAHGAIPRCDCCGGVVKPDVVLYEEMLDDEVTSGAVDVISKAEVLIVGGTSLVVYPAAGMINYFKGKSLILINKTPTQYDSRADLVIYDSLGKVLSD